LGGTDSGLPHPDRGSPTGVHRYPPRRRSQRNECARSRRGSPLWTPWTTAPPVPLRVFYNQTGGSILRVARGSIPVVA
jgi:hypothetical protein